MWLLCADAWRYTGCDNRVSPPGKMQIKAQIYTDHSKQSLILQAVESTQHQQ